MITKLRAKTKLREKPDKPWSLDEISQFLSQQGIRPSFHRLKIFEYLINERTHPTADEIYEVLKKEIPAISRATVYNTLRLFLENKLSSCSTSRRMKLAMMLPSPGMGILNASAAARSMMSE